MAGMDITCDPRPQAPLATVSDPDGDALGVLQDP